MNEPTHTEREREKMEHSNCQIGNWECEIVMSLLQNKIGKNK